jgi:hypothetical protein
MGWREGGKSCVHFRVSSTGNTVTLSCIFQPDCGSAVGCQLSSLDPHRVAHFYTETSISPHLISLSLSLFLFVDYCCFLSYWLCSFRMSCTWFILLVTLTIDSLTGSQIVTERSRLSTANIDACDLSHSCSNVLHLRSSNLIYLKCL